MFLQGSFGGERGCKKGGGEGWWFVQYQQVGECAIHYSVCLLARCSLEACFNLILSANLAGEISTLAASQAHKGLQGGGRATRTKRAALYLEGSEDACRVESI